MDLFLKATAIAISLRCGHDFHYVVHFSIHTNVDFRVENRILFNFTGIWDWFWELKGLHFDKVTPFLFVELRAPPIFDL